MMLRNLLQLNVRKVSISWIAISNIFFYYRSHF